MADNKIIAASVQVDTDAAQKNVLKLKGNVEDLKKEFKAAAAGSDEQLAALKRLQAAEQDLTKAQGELDAVTNKSAGGFSKIKEGISQIPGATGSAGKGVSALDAQFKKLLANPIVLIIAAIVTVLVALYKAFTSTDEGAQKFQSILDGIGSVIREITQRVAGLANAVIKLLSGDFSGAMEEGKKAVTGFGDAMVDAFKRGKEASDLLDEVADATRVLEIQYAALNARLAKSKEILTDENATFEEKRKALAESGEEIDKYYKKKAENDEKELTAIGKKYNIEERLNELRKKGFEQGAEDFDNFLQTLAIGEDGIKDIEGAIKKSIASQQELSAKQRQQNKAEQNLQKQEAAKLKEERQKAAEEEKARRQNLIEYTNKLLKLQQENELALIKDGYLKESIILKNKIEDDKRQNEESYKQKKISLEQLNALNEALETQQQVQQDALREKYKKDQKAKEAAFQKELADITNKTKLEGIKDTRAAELVQLEIGYEEKKKQAIEKYKDNADQLAKIQAAIDEQYRKERADKEQKFQEEDDKKKLDQQIAAQQQIVDNPGATFEAKRAAIDEEIKLNQELYDKRLVTIEQFNTKNQELHNARLALGKAEVAATLDNAGKIGNLFENLSEVVGKQTVVGKALSVASATISAIQSAISSYNAMAAIPIVGPALGVVAAAAALASGIANVKKIIAVKVPGKADGAAPNLGGVSVPAAPLVPTQTSTSLNQDSINGIGNAAIGGVNGIRAYVVEQDSKEAAARAARLQGAAVLGG